MRSYIPAVTPKNALNIKVTLDLLKRIFFDENKKVQEYIAGKNVG